VLTRPYFWSGPSLQESEPLKYSHRNFWIHLLCIRCKTKHPDRGSVAEIKYQTLWIKKTIPKAGLDIISKRAARGINNYAVSKCVINCYNQGSTRIGKYLREKSYINDRNPGKVIFLSDAKKKAGKNCILSKLNFFSELSQRHL